MIIKWVAIANTYLSNSFELKFQYKYSSGCYFEICAIGYGYVIITTVRTKKKIIIIYFFFSS